MRTARVLRLKPALPPLLQTRRHVVMVPVANRRVADLEVAEAREGVEEEERPRRIIRSW
jgi:hypothetical protein